MPQFLFLSLKKSPRSVLRPQEDHSYAWDSTDVVDASEVRGLETQQTEAVQ